MALQKISPSKNNITLLDPRNSNRKYHQAKTTLPCWIPETVIPPESPLTLTPKTAEPWFDTGHDQDTSDLFRQLCWSSY